MKRGWYCGLHPFDTTELTAPRFGQRTLEDGSILPGLAEHLVEAAGTGDDFAKSEDRYKEFIAS